MNYLVLVRTSTNGWARCASETERQAAHAQRRANGTAVGNTLRGQRIELGLQQTERLIGDTAPGGTSSSPNHAGAFRSAPVSPLSKATAGAPPAGASTAPAGQGIN